MKYVPHTVHICIAPNGLLGLGFVADDSFAVPIKGGVHHEGVKEIRDDVSSGLCKTGLGIYMSCVILTQSRIIDRLTFWGRFVSSTFVSCSCLS